MNKKLNPKLNITKTFISVQIGKYFSVCFSWGDNIENIVTQRGTY